MVPTDENGGINIELLKRLPLEDRIEIQGFMTPDQWKYYCEKIFTQNGAIKEVVVDFTMEDEEDWGWGIDGDKLFKRLKERYLKNDTTQ